MLNTLASSFITLVARFQDSFSRFRTPYASAQRHRTQGQLRRFTVPQSLDALSAIISTSLLPGTAATSSVLALDFPRASRECVSTSPPPSANPAAFRCRVSIARARPHPPAEL